MTSLLISWSDRMDRSPAFCPSEIAVLLLESGFALRDKALEMMEEHAIENKLDNSDLRSYHEFTVEVVDVGY